MPTVGSPTELVGVMMMILALHVFVFCRQEGRERREGGGQMKFKWACLNSNCGQHVMCCGTILHTTIRKLVHFCV